MKTKLRLKHIQILMLLLAVIIGGYIMYQDSPEANLFGYKTIIEKSTFGYDFNLVKLIESPKYGIMFIYQDEMFIGGFYDGVSNYINSRQFNVPFSQTDVYYTKVASATTQTLLTLGAVALILLVSHAYYDVWLVKREKLKAQKCYEEALQKAKEELKVAQDDSNPTD